MKREFIVRALKARTDPFFNINDLPGSGGRMDLVARCISSALFVSHKIRRNTVIHVVLEGPSKPPKVVSFNGETLRKVSPDERNIASHIRIALKIGLSLKKGEEKEVSPGIKIANKSWEKLVKEKLQECKVFYLHAKGEPFETIEKEIDRNDRVCFLLGDHLGIPRKSELFLEKLGIKKISFGRVEYLASHAIVITHYKLDFIEYY